MTPAAISIAAIAALLATAGCERHERDHEPEGGGAAAEAKESHPFALEHEADGTAVIVATEEACKAAGIEVGRATPRDVPWIALAHGVLREDPARVTVLRAPFGGELAAGDVEWPALGAKVAAGAVVARLLPRAQPLTPAERADVAVKLADAKATKTAAEAEFIAAKSELARVKDLNAHDKGASDRAVEAATVAVAAGEAKLRAADESVAIFATLIAAPLAPLAPVELKVARGGTLLSSGARIGEAVEAGAELLRVADLGSLLAAVTLPAGPDPGASPSGLNRPAFSFASATVRSDDGTSAPAAVLGQAPESAPVGRTLLLKVDAGERPLRPGQSIVAELARSGEPNHALSLPEPALVRYAGASWVYVALEPGHFARARVRVDRVADGEVIVADVARTAGRGFGPDTPIVRAGAASLLSVEQLAAGGGGE
jgi:hypothetical protein